jgi:hypothetical protein
LEEENMKMKIKNYGYCTLSWYMSVMYNNMYEHYYRLLKDKNHLNVVCIKGVSIQGLFFASSITLYDIDKMAPIIKNEHWLGKIKVLSDLDDVRRQLNNKIALIQGIDIYQKYSIGESLEDEEKIIIKFEHSVREVNISMRQNEEYISLEYNFSTEKRIPVNSEFTDEEIKNDIYRTFISLHNLLFKVQKIL